MHRFSGRNINYSHMSESISMSNKKLAADLRNREIQKRNKLEQEELDQKLKKNKEYLEYLLNKSSITEEELDFILRIQRERLTLFGELSTVDLPIIKKNKKIDTNFENFELEVETNSLSNDFDTTYIKESDIEFNQQENYENYEKEQLEEKEEKEKEEKEKELPSFFQGYGVSYTTDKIISESKFDLDYKKHVNSNYHKIIISQPSSQISQKLKKISFDPFKTLAFKQSAEKFSIDQNLLNKKKEEKK